MFFQVTHVHTNETCPAVVPATQTAVTTWWEALKTNSNVRIVDAFMSPIAHTIHMTIEADDYLAVAKALGPLNMLGAGEITPVIPLDLAFSMAQAGDFRLPGK